MPEFRVRVRRRENTETDYAPSFCVCFEADNEVDAITKAVDAFWTEGFSVTAECRIGPTQKYRGRKTYAQETPQLVLTWIAGPTDQHLGRVATPAL